MTACDQSDSALPAAAFPYVIDPTTAFTVTASADDGMIEGFAYNTYPPACNWAGSLGSYVMHRSYWSSNHAYATDYSFIRWDTSALGAAATVTAAAWVTYVYDKSNANNRNWQGDWYSWSPPVSCSSYVNDAPTYNAFSVSIDALTLNALNTTNS